MSSTLHRPLAAPQSSLLSPRQAQRGQWLMVAGGLLLGTLGVFVEEAGQNPLTTVWCRCLFGALFLGLWGLATGRWTELRLRGRALAAACTAGLLMMTSWALFFAAIPRTSIGVATVAVHIQPFWVIALGAWWLREPVSRGQLLAALTALAGLALASGLASASSLGSLRGGDYIAGLLMCVGASLCNAVVTLIAKTVRSVSSYALAWWQCGVGALALAWLPFVAPMPGLGSSWLWLAGLGVIHTGLAYVLLYGGMAHLSAGRIAVLQFVYPATAVLVDWAVYGRALDPVQMLGVALMGAALWRMPRNAPTKLAAIPPERMPS